jgi:hypothetical protein
MYYAHELAAQCGDGGLGGIGGLEGIYSWSYLTNNAPTPTVGSWSIIEESSSTYNYYWWGYDEAGHILYNLPVTMHVDTIMASTVTNSSRVVGTMRGASGNNGVKPEGY